MKVKIDKTNLLLGGLTLYTLILVVLALDQLLPGGPWIMVPALDRQLLQEIETLASADEKERKKAEDEIVSYHEFSIPLLIKTLKRDDPELRGGVRVCLVRIAQEFFDEPNAAAFEADPELWSAWWQRMDAKLERAAKQAEADMQKGAGGG